MRLAKLIAIVANSFRYNGFVQFAKPESRKMLKEMDAILDAAAGNNDDSHFEEEDVMVDGNIPVSPNSGPVSGTVGSRPAMKV